MSSVIAVSVSLLGLSLALFTLIIFIQMILSFPAMLSSNSQAYVQQQRKLHHISSRHDLYDETSPEELAEDNDEGLMMLTERWEDRAVVVDEELTRGRTLRRQGSRLEDALAGCRRQVRL